MSRWYLAGDLHIESPLFDRQAFDQFVEEEVNKKKYKNNKLVGVGDIHDKVFCKKPSWHPDLDIYIKGNHDPDLPEKYNQVKSTVINNIYIAHFDEFNKKKSKISFFISFLEWLNVFIYYLLDINLKWFLRRLNAKIGKKLFISDTK